MFNNSIVFVYPKVSQKTTPEILPIPELATRGDKRIRTREVRLTD